MLNSPVFSGLCQPRPIYIKGLIPSPAHFSAPGKSPRCLFLVCKDCLLRGKDLPGSAIAAAQAERGCPSLTVGICRRFSISPVSNCPYPKLIVRLDPPFPKRLLFNVKFPFFFFFPPMNEKSQRCGLPGTEGKTGLGAKELQSDRGNYTCLGAKRKY